MTRVARLGVAGTLAALALTGCTTSPSTAYTVNGKTVTIAQLWESVDACAAATGVPSEEIWRDIGAYSVRAEVAQVIMDARGISFSEAELASIVQNGAGNHALADPTCKAVMLGGASWEMLSFRLGTDEFDAAVREIDVEVNPRYGYWDPTSGRALGSGSLSSSLAPR
jgi:hypothetical protein